MTTTASSSNDASSETSETSIDDEIEPKLKYARLSNDLQQILFTSSATCIAVHPKFICLGTHWGVIHLLDHQGNIVPSKELRKHTVAVNAIHIDASGEHVATCSDDGKIYIHGLFSHDHAHHLNVGRLVKCVSLDPLYHRSPATRRFIAGDERLTLYEKAFLGGLRPQVLADSEGPVRSLAWRGEFVAWASDAGVRVYDLTNRCSLGLIKWDDGGNGPAKRHRCNLRWADQRTLLIGWMDTVRVCAIRKRSGYELANRDLPEFIVDPISTFQTEFLISGIAPLDHQLVLLGCSKDKDMNGKSFRPQLYIVEYRDNDYIDVCTDSLSLRGYEEYDVNDYHLDVLVEENRFFIVAPRDVVVASPYDLDDRIQWFIQHSKYEEALEILMQNKNGEIQRHTIESVGMEFLDYLLEKNFYDNAGKLCMKIFDKNSNLWEDVVFKFTAVHQLRSISPYIPQTIECKLNPHIYELILYEYLKMDSMGFLNLIKEWNFELYNVCAVINAVLEHLLICDNDKHLYLEALALLYSYQKQYDKSLSMYLKLKHKDVFTLIKKHNLYGVIQEMLTDLMDLDYKKTVVLLLEKNTINSDKIVEKLKGNELHLYRYLDEYDKRNPKGDYHKELVRLYAIFAREKLLPFLKKSDHYLLREALDICQKANYYPETVYLLGRIGETKEALELIIEKLKDVKHAIEFCREHDDYDLWNELIDHSLDKPEFIHFLLQTIGTYVDPTRLIRKIDGAMPIPGLKNALVMMLRQYNLQMAVQAGCKRILDADYFDLFRKLIRTQQRGVCVSDETVCGACHRKILDRNQVDGLVIYQCRHLFHERCQPDNTRHCMVCFPSTIH